MGASRRRTPSMVPRKMRFSPSRSCRDGAAGMGSLPSRFCGMHDMLHTNNKLACHSRLPCTGKVESCLRRQPLLRGEVPALQVLDIIIIL